MIGQSFAFIFLLSVVSSIYSQPDPREVLSPWCEASMKAINTGTFEKKMKLRQECREKAVPRNIRAAFKKCEAAMPMTTANQIKKVCSNIDANIAKMTQLVECAGKVLGDKYMDKFMDCCKVMNLDNQSFNLTELE